MAKLRLSAATADWQCALANTPRKWSFGFSPASSNQLDPDWRLLIAESSDKENPLFVIKCGGENQWSIENQIAAHSKLTLLLNGTLLEFATLRDGDILTLGSNVHLMVSVEGAVAFEQSADSPSDAGAIAKRASSDTKKAANKTGSATSLPNSSKYGVSSRARAGRSILILFTLLATAMGGGAAALKLRAHLPSKLAGKTSHGEIAISIARESNSQKHPIDNILAAAENSASSSSNCIDQAMDQRRTELLKAFDGLAKQFANYIQTPNRKLASQLAAFQVQVEQSERNCFSSVLRTLKTSDSSMAKETGEVADRYFQNAAYCLDFKSELIDSQIPLAQFSPAAKIHLAKPRDGEAIFASSQFAWRALTQVAGFQKLWNALSQVHSPALLVPQKELLVRDVLEMRAQLLVTGPEISGPPTPDTHSLLAFGH